MAELQGAKKRVIAFYLPQFHTIPENDLWWGKGFTEWTNTKKAKPLFEGHYQPRTPMNENYYDLSDVSVMEEQAKLAKKYGLFGFCYYHYWFKNGKKLLEKPIDNMLEDADVDIPFCLCWANENWSRNWDGGNREILMQQDYGDETDWEQHFSYFLPFFQDKRYITYEGKPVLLIYRPELIRTFDNMVGYWQRRIKEYGFPGLIIVRQFPEAFFTSNSKNDYIDFTIKFQPTFSSFSQINNYGGSLVKSIKKPLKQFITLIGLLGTVRRIKEKCLQAVETKKHLEIYDYDDTWRVILQKDKYNDRLVNGAFVDWDNTPRNKTGRAYVGATPEKFGKYMEELLRKPTAMNSVFINAWNEWAEGAYLEPDEKYGYGYLEALKKALDAVQ